MSRIKLGLAGVVAVALLLQLTNPARTNPAVKKDFLATVSPPPNVAAMVRAACYDCHSSETRWPWYSRVAPASWTVVNDVNRARARLNLSNWPSDAGSAVRKLEAMSDEIKSGEMPLRKYTLIHHEARLTPEQRNQLTEWLASQATNSLLTGHAALTSTANPPDSSVGRTLFLKNCAHCHGADARGDEGPDLHNLDWTDDQIVTRIRTGKKGEMTAFAGKLSPDEINALLVYVRTLK